MTLLEVIPWGTSWCFGVGQGPEGNSELRDFFRDMESNPEAKSSIHQHDSRQLESCMKGFPPGWQDSCSSYRHRARFLWHMPGACKAPGGILKADSSRAQQTEAVLMSSSFPECQLKQWSSSLGFQLPSCLQGSQEPAPLPSWPRKPSHIIIFSNGWAQLPLNWWPGNLH